MDEGLRLQIAHLLVCKMKYGNRTWNASEALSADLKHSGLLAIIAASDWHKTHQWYNGLWSSWCKATALFCVTSSLLALQFAVLGACQQYIFQISSAFGFCLNVKGRALS